MAKEKNRKKLFIGLWLLSILGIWSVLPYVQALGIIPLTVSFSTIFLLATMQGVLFFGIICWLSYLLVSKTDLSPFDHDNPIRRIIYPGVISGVSVGLIIYVLNITIYKDSLLSQIHPPFLYGFLASFYGAINEEILFRLFLFTFIYFLCKKVFKFKVQNRLYFLWISNVIVAITFGMGHLPATFRLINPNSSEIVRILLLNGIPGIVFGWLYWFRGLWASMTSHFVADLCLHVILI